MNKTQEALKMAIEALSQDEGWFEPEAAIKACKEALAQPAQKPVADYVIIDGLKYPSMVEVMAIYNERGEQTEDNCDCINAFLPQGTKLYTHPAPQPEQEPVAWNEEEFNAIAYAYRTCPAHEIKMVSDRYQELVNYVLSITHPAPSWQGLESEKVTQIIHGLEDKLGMPIVGAIAVARAIEQALKEKNHAL